MSRIKIAIVGAGHLGKIHTRLAKTVEEFEVVGVVDPFPQARATIQQEFQLPTFSKWQEIEQGFDAAIIATPTMTHAAMATELMQAGKHCLVEKPITLTHTDGEKLCRLAKRNKLTLQTGHVERFNPVFKELQKRVPHPRYIETHRMSEYTFRSTDVGVVLDLLIHDLDLVLSLTNSDVIDVRAIGISVMGKNEDISQVRLEFANGSVANMTASRCSFVKRRDMQVFSDRGWAFGDFNNHSLSVITPRAEMLERGIEFLAMNAAEQASVKQELFTSFLPIEQVTVEKTNAILDEQKDFAQSIRTGKAPVVTGDHGTAAVEVAERIIASIQQHAWYGEEFPIRGPLALPIPQFLSAASAKSSKSAKESSKEPVRRAG